MGATGFPLIELLPIKTHRGWKSYTFVKKNSNFPKKQVSGARRAWVETDTAALGQNVHALQQFLPPNCAQMAVVKANAYGHGLLPVARRVLEAGAAWLGVATVEEGMRLRRAGLTAPVCLLCAAAPQQMKQAAAWQITPTISSTEMLQAFAAAAGRGSAIHLEIDTGMGRAGVLPQNAVALWRQAVQLGLQTDGVCTHFADAENPDALLTDTQEAAFWDTVHALQQAGAAFSWVHQNNSAAVLSGRGRGANLVRCGLLLYGILPQMETSLSLRPALSLYARVALVRSLPAGHTISYGATCRLERPSRVATVLIGYGDGYSRRLSNQADMLLHGCRAPVLGRVCMDQCVLDVTHLPEVQAGDTAVCIGEQGRECIRAEELARLADTTEHEITTALSDRLPRIYLP